jgi:phage shock protein PspC (stress-responsive transcriptional regulator)
MAMVLPAVLILVALVLGLFVNQRYRLVLVPLAPRTQIVLVALIMGVIGGSAAYFSDDVRGVPLLIGTTVLWCLIAPALHLGNWIRDRIAPRSTDQYIPE